MQGVRIFRNEAYLWYVAMTKNEAQHRRWTFYEAVNHTAKKESTMGRQKDPRQLEKFMSYILGRRPDEFGLVLDENGFVRLKDLLKAISEEPGWGYVRKSHIHEVLMISREDSFVMENDRIKAVASNNALNQDKQIVPPGLLYHCVRRRAYPVVFREGITPLGQAGVFLATTKDLALRIGKRRDTAPVLLTVHADKAFEAGIRFSRQGEFIYITDHVPVGCFSGPPLPKEKKESPKPKRESIPIPEELPGGFALDMERSRTLHQQRLKQKGLKKEISWKKDARRLRRRRKK